MRCNEAALFRGIRVAIALVLGASAGPCALAQEKPAQSYEASQESSTQRYANMPEEAVPYRKFTKPYKEWYLTDDTLAYNGGARLRSDEEFLKLDTVNIGFLGPLEGVNPESPYGRAMLQGAKLAVEQANARGGYHVPGTTATKPYELKVHNDSVLWGASSTEAVKMGFDEHVVGILGSVDGASTHILLRVTLKLEIPIMDTATTDPTVTETRIPWLIHVFPDDRQQGYALANIVFKDRKLKRVGLIRTQSRYAREGIAKFADEARRMGRVPALEVKFERGDQDFAVQLKMLQNARVDGVVIWGEPAEAALILKQLRAMGMQQPAFGSSRLAYPELIDVAGPAAEGMTLTAALDPTRYDAKWLQFVKEYKAKYNQEPDAYAARAYDGMNLLLQAIQKAGLNRGRVMDALRDYQSKSYDGVVGIVEFDHTLNDTTAPTIVRVDGGKFVYSAPRQSASQGPKEKPGDR